MALPSFNVVDNQKYNEDDATDNFTHGQKTLSAKRYPATALAVTGFVFLITFWPIKSYQRKKMRPLKPILERHFEAETSSKMALRVGPCMSG